MSEHGRIFSKKIKAMRTISGKKLQEEEAKTTRELSEEEKDDGETLRGDDRKRR